MEWGEVVTFLRERYQVGHATHAWIELWRSYREDGRAIRQQLTLRTAEFHGELYYVVEAEVAVPVHVRAALKASARLTMGRLVDRHGVLVAHTQVPASAMTVPALDQILAAIGREAMRLSLYVWERQAAGLHVM